MIVAVIIHSLIALSFLGDPHYSFLSYFVGAIVLCNIIGIMLISTNKKILGAKIFMISSAILVPVELIGAIGARKIIDEEKKKNFYND